MFWIALREIKKVLIASAIIILIIIGVISGSVWIRFWDIGMMSGGIIGGLIAAISATLIFKKNIYIFRKLPSYGFDCVAGMTDLKILLINDVLRPLLFPKKYKKFRLSIPNGILLYGPPGCGKTFIVQKLAEELGYNFIELNPSSVATPYVHGAVSNIAEVFEKAKQEAPSIVFIDEIEGLMPKREGLSSFSDIKKEEVNEFLLQLNKAGENKILVVGATNRPHIIDTAILRSGRMDKRIYVSPPDFEARKELFKIYLSGRPYDKNMNFDKLAESTNGYACSDIELIVTEAARAAVALNKKMITEDLFTDAILKITPSISPEDIQYYEQFQDMERW